MNLKQRLALIENKLNPPQIKKHVIIISTAFIPGEEKPLIGCKWRDEYIERLENESEKDFYNRVETEIEPKMQVLQSVDLVWSMYEGD